MTLNRLAGHAHTHARTHTRGNWHNAIIYLVSSSCIDHGTVVNSTSTNMSYYYRQTSTSDFEQQLDYSKTHYSGYVFLACR